jgi:hypothetical protein
MMKPLERGFFCLHKQIIEKMIQSAFFFGYYYFYFFPLGQRPEL